LPSFANKIVDEIDVMARMKEMPDPFGAGSAIEGSGIASSATCIVAVAGTATRTRRCQTSSEAASRRKKKGDRLDAPQFAAKQYR
jgi:hypothetical protein